jgi:hypothetical protein
VWLLTLAQQMFLFILPSKRSWVKRNGTTQVMYITKLKDGPKRVKKTFSMISKRGFELVWWRGRKWNHIKKDLWSWSFFLLSKYWLPLLFVENVGAFFLFSFFLFFYAPPHEDLGVLIIFEEKITSSKTSFQMAWYGMTWSWLWIYWQRTHIPKWSYTRQYS